MARYLLALALVIAGSVVTSTAFGSQKGFYIGGGLASRTSSGDLDGESVLLTEDGVRGAGIGKIDNGTGLLFDIGYNFGSHFGLEYLETHTGHRTKHQLEPKEEDASVSTSLLGFRLSTGLGDKFDFFARVGLAAAQVYYPRYGHKGTTTTSFTPSSDESFFLRGTGYGYGVGAEAVFGKHLGFGLGYTVYTVTFDSADIAGTSVDIKRNKPNATFATPDFTVLWHF